MSPGGATPRTPRCCAARARSQKPRSYQASAAQLKAAADVSRGGHPPYPLKAAAQLKLRSVRVTLRNNTQRVGHKPERDRLGFAQVLTVDVKGDRALGLEGELAERGRADHIPPCRQFLVVRVHHVPERGKRGQRAESPQREQVKSGAEVHVRGAHRVAP